jgi:SelR domain
VVPEAQHRLQGRCSLTTAKLHQLTSRCRPCCSHAPRGCDSPLFSSNTKFESATGWPSFWAPFEGAIETSEDRGFFLLIRTEVHCRRCGGHLGHILARSRPACGIALMALHSSLCQPEQPVSCIFMWPFGTNATTRHVRSNDRFRGKSGPHMLTSSSSIREPRLPLPGKFAAMHDARGFIDNRASFRQRAICSCKMIPSVSGMSRQRHALYLVLAQGHGVCR